MTTFNTETASSPTSSYTSLLSPPNPALEVSQPPGSILINRNDPSCLPPDQLAAQLNPTGSSPGGRGRNVASAIKSSFSINNAPGGSGPGGTRRPGPPAAVFNRRARASSVTGSSTSASSSSTSTRSPLVSFAPLPPVPDLERRRSITLGIAARSNLLKTQGGARSGAGGGTAGGNAGAGGKKRAGGSQVLMMTDEEWEEYKRNIQQRNSMSNQTASSSNSQYPPEIHRLVKRGTKKLWKKARSMSSSSSTSSASGSASGGTSKLVTPVPASPSALTTGLSVPVQESTVGIPTSPGGRTRNGLISRIRESSTSSSSAPLPQLQRPGSPPAGRSVMDDPGREMLIDDDDEDAIMSDPEMDENALESGSGSEYDLSSSYGSSTFGPGGMGDLSERVILERPEEEEMDEMDQDQEAEDDNEDEEDEDRSSTSSSSIRSHVETPEERRLRRRREEEDEMKDAGEIPAYLRRDSAAEQHRYQHLHVLVQEGASTPRERREGLLSHSGLTDRLRALQVEGRSSREGSPDGLGSRAGGDGDETPKGRTSPRVHTVSLPAPLA